MNAIFKYFACTLFFIGGGVEASELTLAQGIFSDLKASYFEPQQGSTRAVLMLHQCNSDRSMYDVIGPELGRRGAHALSMDFRGFSIFGDWPKDVQLAYDFLRNKIGENGKIGVIGASCGGDQAKILVKNNSINVLAFFSSSVVDEKNKDSIADYASTLAKMPTLFISAENDFTYNGTKEAASINTHKSSLFLSYEGNLHGYPLLDKYSDLTQKIVEWFSKNLAEK
ncbi:MAG: esterase/lipase [Flavobacteriales bacterium]|jgi:esterase/lipase